MFEEFYKNIELTDAEIYFLAKELEMNQIIGLGFDYESMNKEMKNTIKQESYDLFEKQQALKMDFSGNTTVNEDYANVVKSFEFPNYCGIVQHVGMSKEVSALRKVYCNDNKWTALDYERENLCSIYVLPDKKHANDFLYFNLNIASNDKNNTVVTFDSLEKLKQVADDIVATTEYIKNGNTYKVIQRIFVNVKNMDWFEADVKSEETNIILIPFKDLVKVAGGENE